MPKYVFDKCIITTQADHDDEAYKMICEINEYVEAGATVIVIPVEWKFEMRGDE